MKKEDLNRIEAIHVPASGGHELDAKGRDEKDVQLEEGKERRRL